MKRIIKMKKRIISLFLLALLLFSVCACSSDENGTEADRDTVKIFETDRRKDDVVTDDKAVTDKETAVTDEEVVVTEKEDIETEAPVLDENTLDPFEGLKVEFDGISPFCTVSFNNAKCSEKVQQYVDYSIEEDKVTTEVKQFKLNEEVTIYASLKKGSDKTLTLAKTQQNYKVENVPEYITEITEDMDLSKLKAEAKDYLDSITAFTKGNYAFGVANYVSHTTQHHESYFSTLKLHSHDKFKTSKEYDYYNKINIMYRAVITNSKSGIVILIGEPGDHNVYFTVCAKNIVRYPDGTIGWGKSGPDTLAFEYNTNTSDMESLVNSNITSIKADFNVTKINELLP